jgi:uncharacterized protein (DUF2236 family)
MAGSGEEGLFAPDSLARRWCSLKGIALAAPRAVMLQYAHPQFAAASHRYSSADASPGARFDRAVRALRAMIFEPRAKAERHAHRVDRLHANLSGTLQDGSPWSARDPGASAWVLITLVDAVILGADLVLGRRPDHQVAQALIEARTLGRYFHVREDDLPTTRSELVQRVERAVQTELVIGSEARAMWAHLGRADAARRRDRATGWVTARFAAATLPAGLRAPLGVSMSSRQERALLGAGKLVARAISL